MKSLTLFTALPVILFSLPAQADDTIQLLAHARTDNANGLDYTVPGDRIYFQIGVSVIDDGSNAGLATIVYDVESPQTVAMGYALNQMTAVDSGYTNYTPQPHLGNVTRSMYAFSESDAQSFYNGGWGFCTAGLPMGGNTASRPGAILGAGIPFPMCHEADVNPNYPGLQPDARLGVGHGLYIFPEDDPILAGLQGGFGQDLTDPDNIIPGNGTWVFQEGYFDTTGWLPRQYTFEVTPTVGAVLSATLDYSQDMCGGFRIAVPPEDMSGYGFQFTLIPEPTSGALLLFGAAALLRPSRW